MNPVKRLLLCLVPCALYLASCTTIDLYEKSHPDWVLMDIMMEPVDGLSASKTIIAAHPEAKIIILTNYDDDYYRKVAKEAGTRAFILKEHLSEIPAMLLEQ